MMDWRAWILAIAGVLFGGGMLGQLIMFLIKRHDEKKEREREFYLALYNKLCAYKTVLEQMLLNQFKEVHVQAEIADKAYAQAGKMRPIIDSLLESIESQQNICRQKGVPNQAECEACNAKRQAVVQMYDEYTAIQTNADVAFDSMQSYWKNNFDFAHSAVAEYVNIHNCLFLNRKCESVLSRLVHKIDRQSMEICNALFSSRQSNSAIDQLLIDQVGTIYLTLNQLSKNL